MRRGEQIPGPGSPSDLHVCYQVHQQKGRSARSPLSTQTSPDPHRLPEPGWAPSWGQVSSYCPGWARPGPEGLLGHLLRGGRWGRGLAQGSGLRVLGVPSGEFWLERRQRPNCRSQLPAPTRRSFPPPSRPASFPSHPPPAARFYGNRVMLRTDVLLGWTAGDALFLHHAAVTREHSRISHLVVFSLPAPSVAHSPQPRPHRPPVSLQGMRCSCSSLHTSSHAELLAKTFQSA